MNILDEKPAAELSRFVKDYTAVHSDVDIKKALKLIGSLISNGHDGEVYINELIQRWYASGCSDFSVYDDDYYFCGLWRCWVTYSRGYLRELRKLKLRNMNVILDVGCGLGYTTAALKQEFPDAEVYGTNLRGTKQWQFCETMAEKHGFNLIDNFDPLPEVDLLFASEYFEHIQRPIEHLVQCVSLNPKVMVIANAFNTVATGHFVTYYHNGTAVNQAHIGKMFNSSVRSCGYRKYKTGFWNNRPSVWVKT